MRFIPFAFVSISLVIKIELLFVNGWFVKHTDLIHRSRCIFSFDPRSSRSPCSGSSNVSQSVSFDSKKKNNSYQKIQDSNDVLSAKSTKNNKRKLSRSERKALERDKKARKIEIESNPSKLKLRRQQGSYKLHSNAISQLTANSTADDVFRAIKRAQKMHDHHDLRVIADFLIECDVGSFYGYRGSLLARLAVAALRWENHDVARKAIDIRRLDYRASMQPMESSAIIRGLIRLHNVTDALEILNDELSLPLDGVPLDTSESKDRLVHRARSLTSIASRHFFENEPFMAVKACNMISDIGPVIRNAKLTNDELDIDWLKIVRGAAQCESFRRSGQISDDSVSESTTSGQVELPCNLVHSVLSAMTTFPSINDDLIFEAVANALVRRSLFVTGAVSMDSCPYADRGEAAFIGRSNVGKSSLVNMVLNRKTLAYTSKKPGKTQQFNFFTINDKPGREKEIKYGDKIDGTRDKDSFYIVDLPGFGYAKVPEQQRKKWVNFMKQYLETRKNLKVVFHLIDGRHGPIDEDANIMEQVSESLPKTVAYVVVLTKADKNIKKSPNRNLYGKVSSNVMRGVRDTMREYNVGNAPIILTSSTTKLGRNDVWRYLRLAAEA